MPGGYDSDSSVFYHDGDYASGPPGEPNPEAPRAPRHIKSHLSAAAQKVYDQLVDQRDRIAAVDPNAANKLYGPHSDLTADEGMVLMAQELAESGITDIYKVKKETSTDKYPIQYGVVREGGEGADEYGYYYNDPKVGRVPVNPNQITDFKKESYEWDPYLLTTDGEGGTNFGGLRSTPASGYVEVPRTQYINTETGKPLTIDQYGKYAGQEGILQSRGAADRVKIGYGIDFTGEGIPTYFQTAYKEPSSWKRFTNALWSSPIIPIAASLVGGPVAGAIASGARAAYGPGDLSDALKAAALSFGTSMAIEASGIKGLLSGAAPEGFDITDVVPPDFTLGDPTAAFGGMPDLAFGDPSLGDPTAGFGGMPDLGYNPNIPAGEAGIRQILSEAAGASPNYVDDLFSGAGAPTPDVAYPELFAPPIFDPASALETQVAPPGAPPPYEGTFDPASALETQVAPPNADAGTFDPASALETQITPPNANAGISLGAYAAAAGATLAEFAATPLGKLAMSIGGSALVNKLFNEQKGGGGSGGPTGWTGEIPTYQMVRERVPLADTGRRPGEYGRRYFSDTEFVPLQKGEENLASNVAALQAAQQSAQAQAAGLAAIPPGVMGRRAVASSTAPSMLGDALRQNPGLVNSITQGPSADLPPGARPITTSLDEVYRNFHEVPPDWYSPTPATTSFTLDDMLRAINTPPQVRPVDAPEVNMGPVDPNTVVEPYPVYAAQGGLMGLAKGRYLDGPTDGMEDKLKTTIEGEQPARLSHGEFVIPADVVSHLGNGNSQAGAKRLYDMMDKIRMARTGTKKQGKQINPDKYLPR